MDGDSLHKCEGYNAHEKDGEKKSVPYIVHEADMARMERQLKRAWILNVILVFLLFAICASFAWYESQFEDVVETQTITQDLDSGYGGDAIINDGVHVNGESKADSIKHKEK